jgi:hypothetical protein
MHAVVETPTFLRAADREGLTEAERAAIIDRVAADPAAGDEIPGTGGCRKLRFGGRGRGKSGGFRLITFFSGPDVPVFLITVNSKGRRADLTPSERAGLASLGSRLVESVRAGNAAGRR